MRGRMSRKGQPLEADGGGCSSDIHQQVEGIKRATEERNAQVLTALDDHADADDKAGARERLTENGHGRQPHAEKENEGERKDEVDQVARNKRAKRTGVVRPGNEMERRCDKADGDDDGFMRQVEGDHRALPIRTLQEAVTRSHFL